jgi:hypothetical protein
LLQVSALSDKGKAPLTKHQGDSLATQIKGAARAVRACVLVEEVTCCICSALKYVECSALSQNNLKAVFDEAIRAVLKPAVRQCARALCVFERPRSFSENEWLYDGVVANACF